MPALRLKQLQIISQCHILYIRDNIHAVIYEQTQINTAFRDFYCKVDQTEGSINEKDIETFFQDISIPTLKEEERESLEALFSDAEIFSALKALPIGKVSALPAINMDELQRSPVQTQFAASHRRKPCLYPRRLHACSGSVVLL